MRILLVEDTEELAILFKAILNSENYVVDIAEDGQIGWEFFEDQNYDLVILDIMLPKLDGISLCRKIRSHGSQIPILMLTARGTHDDKVSALDSGADDYLIKPPDLKEFTARIRALLRRGHTSTAPTLEWGLLRLDPNQRVVSYGDHPLHFTPKEYAILELFLRNSHRVYSRSQLLEQLWSFDDELPGEETIRAHIKGLRQKLKPVGAENLMETVYGVGYRLNPAYAQVKSLIAKPELSNSQAASLERNTLTQIWKRSRTRILERIRGLENALSDRSQLDQSTREQVIQEAHKLIGSLGAFDLAEGCRIAREIETLAQSPSPPGKVTKALYQLVKQLLLIVETATPQIQENRSHAWNPQILESQEIGGRRLLIVDDDPELTDLLVVEAATRDIQVMVASSAETARGILRNTSVDLVLLDLDLSQTPGEGIALMADLAQQLPHLPIVVFTASNTLAQRMAVVDLKAKGFLQKPKLPAQVLDEIIQILDSSQPVEAKVLVVDDDTLVLKTLQNLLRKWGIQVTSLSDPQNFWQVLEESQPDLLILDVQMPDINGTQICQIIRNDLKWNWLPVMFLTSCTDAETIHQIFAVGADDYFNKPIVAPELITRIFNRLERTRLLRSQSERDGLTDLFNRKRGSQDLNQLLQLAHSAQQTVSLAVLKLDHLQQINQQYDYGKGDLVLRHVGKLLKQELRKEDIVVRWSGAEFVAGMYGIGRSEGIEWLASILEILQEYPLKSLDQQWLPVSFSAGVAQFPDDGKTLIALQQSARSALEQAQQAGGDRVYPATWQIPPQQKISTVDVAIVHPNPNLTKRLSDALERRGYRSQILCNGASALEQFSGKKPKLCASKILIAKHLHDMDGIALLQQLERKKVTRNTRIILLLDRAEDIAAMNEVGYSDYILTSCSLSVIMQHLRQAL
ncbi:MAG: response regulator [Scytolyngbya sp. HA4215-MV1]|jgi:diguanylate cyclase (GGDEF)-like protein|nr:response regulator [Scytolyngbya sp. HA4215-MV1]